MSTRPIRRQMSAPLTVVAPLTVLDRSRKVILRVEGDVATGANLTLGGSGGGTIELATGTGDPVAGLAATASGGAVKVGDAAGELNGVELSVNTEGGVLRVFDKAGEPVGGMMGSARGGRLALTGPGGGFSAVSLGVDKGGGAVRVFSATGGPARAALEADAATGGVTAYDQQGKPAATLASGTAGSGILQLLCGGTTMVEAGTTEDGLGLVRAGPATRGVIGTIVPPHTLMGRKQD